jgi:hypothetical protein
MPIFLGKRDRIRPAQQAASTGTVTAIAQDMSFRYSPAAFFPAKNENHWAVK